MHESDERIDSEVALVQSMYPETNFDKKAQEIRFSKTEPPAKLVVRIPSAYLHSELPIVVLATIGDQDVREKIQQYLRAECATGEECIDRLIALFEGIVDESSSSAITTIPGQEDRDSTEQPRATVVVWLHHLLNTNKRKQAKSPPSAFVNGVTKPGYPGVLVYSGPVDCVQQHVQELRSLNWQAFQVRLEVEEEWTFTHGQGVIEVANMAEMVAEIGVDKKQLFMEAMRMK